VARCCGVWHASSYRSQRLAGAHGPMKIHARQQTNHPCVLRSDGQRGLGYQRKGSGLSPHQATPFFLFSLTSASDWVASNSNRKKSGINNDQGVSETLWSVVIFLFKSQCFRARLCTRTHSQTRKDAHFSAKVAVSATVPTWPGATTIGPGWSNQTIQRERKRRSGHDHKRSMSAVLGPDHDARWKYPLFEQIDHVLDYLRQHARHHQTVCEAMKRPER